MLEAKPITTDQLPALKSLYNAFRSVAVVEYGFPQKPIDFDTLAMAHSMGMIELYGLWESPEDRYVGFMMYNMESYGAVDIKALYLQETVPMKTAVDVMFNRLLEDVKELDNWEVVSYALLGTRQYEYIHYITWPGFTPVGQAVVNFKLDDVLSQAIFEEALKLPPLPEGYRFESYKPEYEQAVIDVIAESFKKSVDALWDPRFRTREGIVEAFEFVRSGAYGVFYPDATSVLLNAEGKPVGVCLLNIISNTEANIPIIGLASSERGKKLGVPLLANTIRRCYDLVKARKLSLKKISATVATGNLPAVRMYRVVGFQEDHWYPHVYQDRENVLARRPGQWC